MPRARTVRGREDELAELDRALSTVADSGALVVVRGAPGSGKTALLTAAAQAWRAAGVQVVEAPCDGDTSGFRRVVHAIRDSFEQLHEPRLTDAIAGLTRSPGWPAEQSVSLVLRLGAMIDLISARAPTVLLVDDVDTVAEPTLALDAARRPGALVIAAYRDGVEPSPALAQLLSLADVVVELTPLAGTAVEAMLGDHHGTPVDTGLTAALSAALGPLDGNPGALLDLMSALAAGGRLIEIHGRLCLAGTDQEPALSPQLTSRLLAGLSPAAAALVTSLASTPVRVDELPMLSEATGATPAGYGRLTDELADAGVLGVDADGRLTCPSPAVAARLVAGTGSAGVVARRRALAEVMLSHFGNGAGTEPADLADRVALAGTALPPDIALARLLMTLAARPDADARRSATWLRAAWWHAGEPGLQGRIAAPLLRRLVQAGRFRELATLIDTVLTTPVPMTTALRDDLAAAAMLAAIHTGVPVDAAVRDRLTAGGRPPAIEFVDRWFAGAGLAGAYLTSLRDAEASELPLVSTAELIEVARIATVGGNRTGDLATALEQVLGDRYHAGADSLPAQYRKVLQGLTNGDFPAALTAARAVEQIGTAQTPLHQLTRIWMTEICTQTGDFQQGRQWLAAVGEPADPALRAWAQCALSAAEDEANDPHARGAFRTGWTAYAEIGSLSRIGAALLVPRLAALAMRSGEFQRGQELLIDINRRHQQDRHPDLDEARLLTQALVRNDPQAAEAAVAAARGRGDLLALLRACITAAQRSETPQPLFAEAYAIANALDADYLCTRLTTLMRRHGVSTRRPRRPREDLSPVELRIIEMICAGRTNREIARHERMSEKTIEDHVSRLFARTGCRTRVQLATASLTGRLSEVMDLAEHAG